MKATVDAYDGTVHLYRTEVGGVDDPILDAWEEIFPDLIEPIANMPADVRAPPAVSQRPAHHPVVAARPVPRRRRRDIVQRHRPLGRVAGGVERRRPGRARGTQPAVSTMMPGRRIARRQLGRADAVQPRLVGQPVSAARDRLSPRSPSPTTTIPSGSTSSRLEPAGGREIASPLVAQSAIDADPELARAVHVAQRQRLGGAVRTDDAVAARRRRGVGATDHRHRHRRHHGTPAVRRRRRVERASSASARPSTRQSAPPSPASTRSTHGLPRRLTRPYRAVRQQPQATGIRGPRDTRLRRHCDQGDRLRLGHRTADTVRRNADRSAVVGSVTVSP